MSELAESAGATSAAGVACPRCQRADGTHFGYHAPSELPFRRGDRVRVRAGATLHTILPNKHVLVNKRTRTIVVFSIHEGSSKHLGYGPNSEDLWQPLDEPEVVWPGTGGYWHRAKMSDCELVERPLKGMAGSVR